MSRFVWFGFGSGELYTHITTTRGKCEEMAEGTVVPATAGGCTSLLIALLTNSILLCVALLLLCAILAGVFDAEEALRSDEDGEEGPEGGREGEGGEGKRKGGGKDKTGFEGSTGDEQV